MCFYYYNHHNGYITHTYKDFSTFKNIFKVLQHKNEYTNKKQEVIVVKQQTKGKGNGKT